MNDDPRFLPITTAEMAELIKFSATSGEAICGTIPGRGLVVSQTGEKTLRKLAEMRGIELKEDDHERQTNP